MFELLDKSRRQNLGHVTLIDAVEHDNEFIAADPSDSVTCSHDRVQRGDQSDERSISSVVPVGVVQRFEMVEIDHGQGHTVGTVAIDTRQRVFETIMQRRAIGGTGKWIEQRKGG